MQTIFGTSDTFQWRNRSYEKAKS